MNTWREFARPIIKRVICEVGTGDMVLLRRALREAYPFGVRQYFPYRVWLDEIQVQLGNKRFGRQEKEDKRQLKIPGC